MEEIKIKSFTDLNAWKEAHKLVLDIYKVTKDFPKEELFGLVIQMRRAVVSISCNIAEGFSRRTALDKNKFYNISQGSITELQNQLLIARDVKYIDNEAFKNLAEQTVVINKMINGLLKTSNDKIPNTKY